jgi:hypothetical protein
VTAIKLAPASAMPAAIPGRKICGIATPDDGRSDIPDKQ